MQHADGNDSIHKPAAYMYTSNLDPIALKYDAYSENGWQVPTSLLFVLTYTLDTAVLQPKQPATMSRVSVLSEITDCTYDFST